MTFENTEQLTENFILKTYGRKKIAFVSGEGPFMYDTNGEKYLDFTSGLGVNALGYQHPKIIDLILKHAGSILHTSNLYHIPAQAEVAEKIVKSSFGERVFFCNSGTEAVEACLKFARKWGKTFSTEKTDFIAFRNSFHGRTFGSMSATMQEKYRKSFEPLVPGFYEAVFNDIGSVEKLISNKTVGIILEPVQGEGGVHPADSVFIKKINDICKSNEILLIVDEVQCGMSRTGKLFAHTHYDITPDLMALAKPLAGGLPVGATVVGKKVWPVMSPGDHASTFGGNHFISGVASGVFDILADADFQNSVKQKGDYFIERLKNIADKFGFIKDVRGKGLLLGIEVDFPASETVEYFENKKILICNAGPNVIRFIPPLIVEKEHIDTVADTLNKFFSEK